jgi:hypothetical protein
MSAVSQVPRHARSFVAVAATVAALAGCADPAGPARVASPNAIIIIGGRPAVLNAQLRAIGDPDIKPPSAVVGHIQLKISESEGTGLVVSWKAHFANPECEAATDFGGGGVMIQDSEDMPSPEDVALIRLVPPGSPLGCGDSFLEGSSAISESLAELLVQGPEKLVAVFFFEGGGLLIGTLQPGEADTIR